MFIQSLKPNEVFVFGSNLAGRHGKGAALTARLKFGAISGIGCGLMGSCYGIATKDERLNVLSLSRISKQVDEFVCFARENGHMKFLVTEIGCGLAGYSPSDIAPLFLKHDLPINVLLPRKFLK
jgi:hypothetical protein